MSVLTIRRLLRRHRRHVAVLATVGVLVGMICFHHSDVLLDMHHDMGAVVEMCLGVFTAVGAAVVAVGLAFVALRRWRCTLTLLTRGVLMGVEVAVARARDGPAAVSVLCVSRR